MEGRKEKKQVQQSGAMGTSLLDKKKVLSRVFLQLNLFRFWKEISNISLISPGAVFFLGGEDKMRSVGIFVSS